MGGSIAVAALLPFGVLGMPLSSVGAAPRQPAPPDGKFLLERVLTRELVDGASIVVIRRWRIGFSAAVSGIVVAGEQIFAEVAAPPALTPLAALEKSRSTSAMFPLALDPRGQIAGKAGRMDAAHLLRAMSAEAVSTMPRDLFFPEAVRSSTTRKIALPGGEMGMISVVTRASVAPGSGLLRASEREIVTRIGDSRPGWRGKAGF